MIRCAMIENLNECEHAKLNDGFYSCNFKDYCQGKRPQIFNLNEAQLLADFLQWYKHYYYLLDDSKIEELIDKFLSERNETNK